jgi:hypothetical protein
MLTPWTSHTPVKPRPVRGADRFPGSFCFHFSCNARRAIEQCGDIYYQFTGREELGSRIKELRFSARSAEAPRRVVNLPYNSLGPFFKGRDAALVELRQRLMGGEGRAVGLTAHQAIHGLGGVGKTRLAVEYALMSFSAAASRVSLRNHPRSVITIFLAEACSTPGSHLMWFGMSDVVARALDVPESWELVGYLCLGYPRSDDDKPALMRVGW